MDTLPRECLQLVGAFACGWAPTPSAQAMRDFWEMCPWLPEMQQLSFSRGARLYRIPWSVGMQCCYKCNSCYMQQLCDIRVKYEPELLDLFSL